MLAAGVGSFEALDLPLTEAAVMATSATITMMVNIIFVRIPDLGPKDC